MTLLEMTPEQNKWIIVVQAGYPARADWSAYAPKMFRRTESRRLPGTSDSMFPKWSVNPKYAVFKNVERSAFLAIDGKQIQLQMIGREEWDSQLPHYAGLVKELVHDTGASDVSRVRVELRCYFDLEMAHAEMVDLLIQSSGLSHDALSNLCGETKDVSITCSGTFKQYNIITSCICMTDEESLNSIATFPNITNFREDNVLDNRLSTIAERFRFNSLVVKSDVTCGSTSLRDFSTTVKEMTKISTLACMNGRSLVLSTSVKPLSDELNS